MAHGDKKAGWLDCDPGHDDVFALILAGHSPQLRLLGCSTVAGNASVAHCSLNALALLHAVGLGHVPVVAGAAKPLTRASRVCPEIHGESGLATHGTVRVPPPPPGTSLVHSKAITFMYTTLKSYSTNQGGRRATLVATGPLTNVALLLSVYPEVAELLEEVVLMGGAVGLGNTRPCSEFNIEVDPEAAAIVFHSGVRVTMVPLEVTHTALATHAVLERVAHGGTRLTREECSMPAMVEGGGCAGGEAEDGSGDPPGATPFRVLCGALLRYFASTYRSMFSMAAPPLHDPCAVFYLICAPAFKAQPCRVEVEVASALCYGRTVVDLHNVGRHTEREKNVNVCLSMDVPVFWAAMLEAIASADAHSPMNDDNTTAPGAGGGGRSRVPGEVEGGTTSGAPTPKPSLPPVSSHKGTARALWSAAVSERGGCSPSRLPSPLLTTQPPSCSSPASATSFTHGRSGAGRDGPSTPFAGLTSREAQALLEHGLSRTTG